MVAAAVGIGTAVAGVAGSAMSSSAAKSAANTQASAANSQAQAILQAQQNLRQDLSPYSKLGQSTIPAIMEMLGQQAVYDSSGNLVGLNATGTGALSTPFSFNASDLQNTPGYQFTLSQGNRAVNNQAAASGLNLSGAQLKGISDYTTGLADQTYNQQYQNALSTYQTNYNVNQNKLASLMSLLGMGENAAAQTGTSGLNAANAAGNALTSGANASAAGTIASANAVNSGLSSVSNAGLLYALMNSSS